MINFTCKETYREMWNDDKLKLLTPRTLAVMEDNMEGWSGWKVLPTTCEKAKFLIKVYDCACKIQIHMLTFLPHGVRQSPTWRPCFQIPRFRPGLESYAVQRSHSVIRFYCHCADVRDWKRDFCLVWFWFLLGGGISFGLWFRFKSSVFPISVF